MTDNEATIDHWEYRIVVCRPSRTPFGIGGYQSWYVDLVDDDPIKGHETMTAYSNRLGAEGWELFSTAFSPTNTVILFYRRYID